MGRLLEDELVREDAMTETSPRDQSKISALCREAERLEEDALYSSKGHFNAEDTWVRRNYWLGMPTTALGAIAGAALIKSRLNGPVPLPCWHHY